MTFLGGLGSSPGGGHGGNFTVADRGTYDDQP